MPAHSFIDGFDHYDNSTPAQSGTGLSGPAMKWDTVSRSTFGAFPAATSPGRFSGQSVYFGAGYALAALALSQGQLGAQATRTVGFALKPDTGWSSGGRIFHFLDGSAEQLSLRTAGSSGYNLSICQQLSSGTVNTLATSTQQLLPSLWVYVELSWTVGGAYMLRVTSGGTAVVWLTGTASSITGNGSMNGVEWINDNAAKFTLDDVYVREDGTFNGECQVQTRTASANGANSGFTPNSGTNHYSRVNEIPPDGDTSYNGSNSAGAVDTYAFPTLSPTGPILAVQNVLCARKDDTGLRTIASVLRGSDGTNRVGASHQLNTSYLMFREIYETDPVTGAAWTSAGLNASQPGAQVTA